MSSVFIPLDPVLHESGGVYTNNIELYDGTSSLSNNNGPVENLDTSKTIGAVAYGLPDGAGVGTMVGGQFDWVTQNDRGNWNQGTCETDR